MPLPNGEAVLTGVPLRLCTMVLREICETSLGRTQHLTRKSHQNIEAHDQVGIYFTQLTFESLSKIALPETSNVGQGQELRESCPSAREGGSLSAGTLRPWWPHLA